MSIKVKMAIDNDIKKTKKSIGNLTQNLNLTKMNIRWGLDIALLSGSFFLFFESVLNYEAVSCQKIVFLGIIFLGFFIDFILTSYRYNKQLKKIKNMIGGEIGRLESLKKIQKSPQLSNIYNKVINRTKKS